MKNGLMTVLSERKLTVAHIIIASFCPIELYHIFHEKHIDEFYQFYPMLKRS